jgi:hypothetical protein
MKLLCLAHIITFLLLCAPSFAGTPCDSVAMASRNGYRAGNVPEADVLRVLRESETKRFPTKCVVGAIRLAGQSKAKRAIPYLLRLLSFKVEVVGNLPSIINEYPAIGALAAHGEAVLSTVLGDVGKNEAGSVRHRNAVWVVMSVYRDDPSKGLALLRQAGDQAPDPAARQRFEAALSYAREKWCGAPRARCGASAGS